MLTARNCLMIESVAEIKSKFHAVQIVIANWNDEETTKKCLEHVRKINYANFYVTVVNSGSNDGSGEILKDKFLWIDVIRLPENRGHTLAANTGAKSPLAESSRYILFLDNDAFLEPSCLKILVNYSEDLDLSWKIYKSGYKIIFVPSGIALHGESKNVIKIAGKVFRDYYTMRNRLHMIRKYRNVFQKYVGIPISIIWYTIVFGIIHTLRGEWKQTHALILAVNDFVKGRIGWKKI